MHPAASTRNIFSSLADFPYEHDNGHVFKDVVRAIPETPIALETLDISSSTAILQDHENPAVFESLIVAADEYRPDDEEFDVPLEDDKDADPDLDAMHTLFDLLDLDEHRAYKPIFTRALLQHVAIDVACILSEQHKSVEQRNTLSIYHDQMSDPPVKIWKARPNANSITVHYMTRVELCPAFQTNFDTISKRRKSLRDLNSSMSEPQLAPISAPYFIESYCRAFDTTHLKPSLMNQWRAKLHHTQRLWTSSTSCKRLLKAVRLGASRLKKPITKIVCIGLGRLNADPAWYQSALQHMSVFSMASCLDSFNRAKNSGCAAVRIIAQDPCYEECDYILLQELTSPCMTFDLSDPETLLSIDTNTLVVSAFLPTSVPLMQIVADMCVGEKGPAMMLWDKAADLRVEKRWYCMRNRDSPAVARFLRGYKPWMRGFGELERGLRTDMWGDGKEGKYWLDGMDFWLRNDG